MPVAWYNSETWEKETHYISAKKVFGIGEENNLLTEKVRHYQKKVGEEYDKQRQAIRSLFGDETGYLTTNEITSIENAWGGMPWLDILKAKKSKISSIRDENWKWMTLNSQTAANDEFWIKQFTNWLNDRVDKKDYSSAPQQWRNMIDDWEKLDPNDKSKRSLDTLFSKSVHVQTYAQYFFDADDERSKISTWDRLKNADISKKKSEKKSE